MLSLTFNDKQKFIEILKEIKNYHTVLISTHDDEIKIIYRLTFFFEPTEM